MRAYRAWFHKTANIILAGQLNPMPDFTAQKHSQYIEASDQFDYGAAQLMPAPR